MRSRARDEALRRLCRQLLRREPMWACLPVEELSVQDWREMMSRVRPATRDGVRAVEQLADFCPGFRAQREAEGCDGGAAPQSAGGRLPLTPEQWRRLLTRARREEHLPCAPALGLMLWGGVAPDEVEQLRWRHILWEERALVIPAKPGCEGGRRLPLRPILCKWLLSTSLFRDAEGPVVPRSWRRRWCLLRIAAGFHFWTPEVLLLTYAACHASFFRDIPALMKELGEVGRSLFPNGAASLPSVPEAWGRAFWEGAC